MNKQDISIELSSGAKLAATLYRVDPYRGAMMIAPATGIKRVFYHAFAEYLTTLGYSIITFDNQGIGDSLEGRISDCNVRLQDWGEEDMPAVLDRLQLECPDTKYHLIGHSAGGQLIGSMHNWKILTSAFCFASSSGSLHNSSWTHWIRGNFFMNVFMPFSNLIFGYAKNNIVGMGEPLPKRVSQQWTKWCNGYGYIKMDFGKSVKEHWYDEVDLPVLWVHATDDDIAIDVNVEDMISVYPDMRAERLQLVPAEHGVRSVGHMKFFSKKNKQLWVIAKDWLEKHDANHTTLGRN